MSSCGSPTRAPLRIRTVQFGPYLDFLGQRFPHLLNDLHPIPDFAIVPDGMMCSVLVAAVTRDSDPEFARRRHPAIDVLLSKEINTDHIVLESFAIPLDPLPLENAHSFDSHISQYWRELCAVQNLRYDTQIKRRIPKTPTPSSSRFPPAEEYYESHFHEPLPFPIQPFSAFFCQGTLNGQSFHLPLSSIFFGSSLHSLRQLSHQALTVSHDPWKHRKAKEKIYVVLCSMVLYFLAVSTADQETSGALGSSCNQREWRDQRGIVDGYEGEDNEVFGTFGWRQNRTFLEGFVESERRNQRGGNEEGGGWFKEAADWWCPLGSESVGGEGSSSEGNLNAWMREGRVLISDGFEKMLEALCRMFEVDSNPDPIVRPSSSRSHRSPPPPTRGHSQSQSFSLSTTVPSRLSLNPFFPRSRQESFA